MIERNEYEARMKACGFAPHEIEECFASPDAMKILEAAETDGERFIGTEDVSDEVLCCPDCETPSQFGERCFNCEAGRALDDFNYVGSRHHY